MVAPGNTYRIVYKPKALADIEEIWSYIAQDSPQNADSVALRLLDSAESLNKFPSRYRIHEHRTIPALTVRSMPVPPWLVCYRIDETNGIVTIMTFRHGARGQPKRFR